MASFTVEPGPKISFFKFIVYQIDPYVQGGGSVGAQPPYSRSVKYGSHEPMGAEPHLE